MRGAGCCTGANPHNYSPPAQKLSWGGFSRGGAWCGRTDGAQGLQQRQRQPYRHQIGLTARARLARSAQPKFRAHQAGTTKLNAPAHRQGAVSALRAPEGRAVAKLVTSASSGGALVGVSNFTGTAEYGDRSDIRLDF